MNNFRFHIVLIFFLVWIANTASSQVPVTGKVTDKQNGHGLEGAYVIVINKNIKTTTDMSGNYKITVPAYQSLKIQASFVGYSSVIKEIKTSSGQSFELDFELEPITVLMPEIFVTANRSEFETGQIPARIGTISEREIASLPVFSTDEVMRLVPGVNVDRDFGMFSKNSSISMRGLGSANRTLVLLDGIPLNKADGGGVNWNKINPDLIDHIEYVKGPNSTIHGGNAMAGVINVITKRPVNLINGSYKTFAGTYGTYGGNFQVGGRILTGSKFYYNLSSFYKSGNGYFLQPDSIRDSMDVKAYVREYETALKAGYQFGRKSYLELEHSFFDDKRGDGFRIFEMDGGFYKYTTNSSRLSWKGNFRNTVFFLNLYNINEIYFRQNESLSTKKNNKYTLYHTKSDRIDRGLLLTTQTVLDSNLCVITGIDFKIGSVDASDIYFTSPDILTNRGKMTIWSYFIDYDRNLPKFKLKLNTGIRYDFAAFSDGTFIIDDPSSFSAFMMNYPGNFSDKQWQAISLKMAIRYFYSDYFNLYLAYGNGFRPPTLDDMCKNGNITKGFKLANPDLKPEKLRNIELGYDWMLITHVKIEQSFYYSYGKDFQYFVMNGDSVYTGGDNLKPIMQRQNIGEVEIFGSELMIRWQIKSNLDFLLSYAWNDSRIKKYNIENASAKDLTGKYLMEVAPNILYSNLLWRTKYLNTLVSFQFRDRQWSDDENITFTPSRYSIDLKFSRIIREHWNLSLSIQDVLNNRYMDAKGQLSPGRFFMFSAGYKFFKTTKNS